MNCVCRLSARITTCDTRAIKPLRGGTTGRLGFRRHSQTAWGTEVVLKDGRVLRGKLGKVARLADAAGLLNPRRPLATDCLSRRRPAANLLLPATGSRDSQEENRQLEEKFAIRQQVLRSGQAIKGVGQPIRIEPFDEFGRRIFTMVTARGPVDVIQGITELTPQWTKVEGISHVWDMRIATSSIPRDTLHRILLKQIQPKRIEDYKKLARFYLQAEHYEEAADPRKADRGLSDQADLKKRFGAVAACDRATLGPAAVVGVEGSA